MSRKQHGKRAAKAVYAPLPDYRFKGTEAEAARLLSAVADALNACEKAGILVQLAHGAAITDMGYVLAPSDGNGYVVPRWAARTRMLSEFPAAADGED